MRHLLLARGRSKAADVPRGRRSREADLAKYHHRHKPLLSIPEHIWERKYARLFSVDIKVVPPLALSLAPVL